MTKNQFQSASIGFGHLSSEALSLYCKIFIVYIVRADLA
jgi:hypothetical protein